MGKTLKGGQKENDLRKQKPEFKKPKMKPFSKKERV